MGNGILEQYPIDVIKEIISKSINFREVLQQINLKPSGSNYYTLQKFISMNDIDISHFKHPSIRIHPRKLDYDKILSGEDDREVTGHRLLKYLLTRGIKERKCEECGCSTWLDQPIPLQLHHIDGDRTNNKLLNLKALCPNCHSLTENYTGKNIKRQQHINKLIENVDNSDLNDSDKNYTIPSASRVLCPVCKSNMMRRESHMCISCYNKQREERALKKEELETLIVDHTYAQIAELKNTTRSRVKYWCRKYGINRK